MEKIDQAFLWLKSKAEDCLSYLSNVTTKCLDDARRVFHNFSEGFKEKLVQSKRCIDETIAKVAGILSNFPKNIVTYLVKVLVTLMLKLMFNHMTSELWKKVKNKCMVFWFSAEIICKVNYLYALVEGFFELLPSYEPVSVVEAVVLYYKFPHITVSEMNVFKNLPEGERKAAVFANSNEVF